MADLKPREHRLRAPAAERSATPMTSSKSLQAQAGSGPAMAAPHRLVQLATRVHNQRSQVALRDMQEHLQGSDRVQGMVSVPVPLRSSALGSMPELEGNNDLGDNANERKRKGRNDKDPEDPTPQKRVTRGSKAQYDLARPSLAFSSTPDGVHTQKLDTAQQIGFDQHATLSRPNGAPLAAATYYHFRQQVKDGYSFQVDSGHDHAVGAEFVQDGPYRPPYNNPVIQVTAQSIDFHDNPGFSGDRRIPVGAWLNWYEVRFRWTVSRADIDSGTWTSPEVVHRVDCPYNDGQDVAVTYTSTGDNTQDVVIPQA